MGSNIKVGPVIRFLICMLALGLAASSGVLGDEPGQDQAAPISVSIDFKRDIEPILVQRCVECHGAESRKGGLRLDQRQLAQTGGDSGPAFLPGKSDDSELVFRVSEEDPTLRMPPKGERLTDQQVQLLSAWIDQGANWPDDRESLVSADNQPGHWSFRTPVRSELPAVENRQWARNSIDRFVLERLEREGLAPSPEADARTLIRRLTLDLIGLPPTPEEVDNFLKDQAPGAYERLVDRLLASPHYGERWARPWLDSARYADTNGYEKDRDRSIWPYRDWVIQALNADMPFDQFTIEQLAGDMLPGATLSQQVATGFHRNTMINEEGGIDVEEFRHSAVVDRVNTTGTVWMGLTIGCAQCHTHKYDPITQREYYQFLAFFNQADEPEIELPHPSLQKKRDELLARVASLEAGLADRFPLPETAGDDCESQEAQRARHLAQEQAKWEESLRAVRWQAVKPAAVSSRKDATMTVLPDSSVLATGDKPNNDVYEVELPLPASGITAFRLEVLPHESLPDGGPGRAPLFSVGDFILTNLEAFLVSPGEPEQRLALSKATEDYCEPRKPAALAIDTEPESGWTVKGGIGKPHAAVFELAEPTRVGAGATLRLVLHQFGIHQMTMGRFRLSLTTDAAPVLASGVTADVEDALLVPASERSAQQQEAIKRQFLTITPALKDARREIDELLSRLPKLPATMVMQERAPEHRRVTHIHPRGEFLKLAEPVEPATPAVFPPLPDGASRDRLTLARWLVSNKNPLVARVAVNRLWHAHFGRGLVATAEDFGTRGEPPSHPELLDWLATELMRRNWSLKAIHRLIVTSATYRQRSDVSPTLRERDPTNMLLSRGARFRLEAEVIRDVALAASGLLEPRLGGPSVYPPQPEGVTSLAYGQMTWPTSTGRDRYRRGLYTFTKRTAPYAAFGTFDQPTSEVACVRRERSNTPLQALTLLNDAVFIEAAQALARRVMSEDLSTSVDPGVERLSQWCLSRPATEPERQAVRQFFQNTLQRVESGEIDPKQLIGLESGGTPPPDLARLAAWSAVARAYLNLDETITRE